MKTHPRHWGCSSSLFCRPHWWLHRCTCLNPAPGHCPPDEQIQIYIEMLILKTKLQSIEGKSMIKASLTLDNWSSNFTLSKLPSADTVRPGFLNSGRPSLRQVRVGGGIASLWQCSSTGRPSITVAFTSSPFMLGGTVADTKMSYWRCSLLIFLTLFKSSSIERIENETWPTEQLSTLWTLLLLHNWKE